MPRVGSGAFIAVVDTLEILIRLTLEIEKDRKVLVPFPNTVVVSLLPGSGRDGVGHVRLESGIDEKNNFRIGGREKAIHGTLIGGVSDIDGFASFEAFVHAWGRDPFLIS